MLPDALLTYSNGAAVVCATTALVAWLCLTSGGGGSSAADAEQTADAEQAADAAPASPDKVKQAGLRRGFLSKPSGGKKRASRWPPKAELAAVLGTTASVHPRAITANERAAHQLMLNSAGSGGGGAAAAARPVSAVEQQIGQTWKKAYWDRFSVLLGESPPDMSMLVEILQDLRTRLIDLTPHREDLAAETREKFDLDLIRQMVDHGAFGASELSGVLEYVVRRLRLLEAPASNEATDKWMADMAGELQLQTEAHIWSTTLPHAFAFLSDKIDAISHGAAQSKFDVLSTFVQQHGAGKFTSNPHHTLTPCFRRHL